MSDLEQRFERLERQNQRYRIALISACLVAVVAFGMTAWPPASSIEADTVECKEVRIVDDFGNVSAILGFSSSGGIREPSPTFSLLNPQGDGAVVMSATNRGGSVYISNEQGEYVTMLSGISRWPGLTFLNQPQGRPGNWISVVSDSMGQTLATYDSKSARRTLLSQPVGP